MCNFQPLVELSRFKIKENNSKKLNLMMGLMQIGPSKLICHVYNPNT